MLNILVQSNQIEVVIAGGLIRHQDGGIVGDATADFVSQFKVDYAVIGASSIENQGLVLDFDWREVRVAQTMIKHARTVILVADGNKFERKAPMRLCELDKIDHFVTDREVPSAFKQAVLENDVTLHVCE